MRSDNSEVLMLRGVVALPHEIQSRPSGFISGQVLTKVQLNYFALYWDKIVVPDNNFFKMGLPDQSIFEAAGLLTRPMIDSRSGIHSDGFAKMYLDSQVQIADQLRSSDKFTAWSIHQTGSNPLILSNGSISKETVRLELNNLLPVPDAGTNLHEILEFKHRRADELGALHSYCDELYFEIINSGDPCLQAAKTFTNLKKAIEDLDKLNAEGWRSPLKFDLDISPEFDLSNIRAGIATIVNAFNTPHVLETVTAGAVISILEGFVKIKPKLQSLRRGGNKNLAFISKARSEGIRK